jgi:hypothetical protein
MSLSTHEITIANELSISEKQVRTTIALLDEGATVPFISRYRKEMTGSLDEVQITNIRDRFQQLRDLDKRKEAVLKSINDQGKLTAELEQQLLNAETMASLEDIYLPYKPKRKTRASVAREKGLQPLADLILVPRQNNNNKTSEHQEREIRQESDLTHQYEAVTGVLMWRAWWTPPIMVIRVASVVHAVAAVWMIGLIIMHVYAAIWTRGTIRAMLYGTVTRAWAKQHHRGWYRKMTGDND